jgi:hypothetical protein
LVLIAQPLKSLNHSIIQSLNFSYSSLILSFSHPLTFSIKFVLKDKRGVILFTIISFTKDEKIFHRRNVIGLCECDWSTTLFHVHSTNRFHIRFIYIYTHTHTYNFLQKCCLEIFKEGSHNTTQYTFNLCLFWSEGGHNTTQHNILSIFVCFEVRESQQNTFSLFVCSELCSLGSLVFEKR